MLCAVVPLVRADFALVNKLVALAFWKTLRPLQLLRAAARRVPRLAAVIRALDDLPEPPAALRRINPFRVRRGTFQMINLPPGKMRPAHIPVLALAIGCQNK